MSNLLVLKSSIMGEQSYSNRLLDTFTRQWNAHHADCKVIEQDLNSLQLPVLDQEIFTALRNPQGQLNARQQEAVAMSDQLIAQLCAADLVVIGAPMYNFNIPTALKNYFDLISRPGITFQYFASGVKGLIEGVQAIIVSTRGGQHYQKSTETVLPILNSLLSGLLNIPVIDQVIVEGIQMESENTQQILTTAQQQLNHWIESFDLVQQ